MQDEHEGAPECDPQKKATEAIEKFEAKARRRAQRVTASRTGKVVPLKKVHLDPRSCDLYQRLIEVTLRAARDWRPDRGMSLEAFISFHLAHTDADSSFLEGPLTVPYVAAQDFLSAKKSSIDPEEQRAHWEAKGRDPLDFDTISHSQSFDQPTLPGDWSAFMGEERIEDPTEVIACTQPGTDALAEARLFLTQDLTEVEQMVLLYHDRDGYTFLKIGRDLLPADLFDNSGSDDAVKHRVRRIYLKAKEKAQDFRNTDGSDL